jgi:hypothetical protein
MLNRNIIHEKFRYKTNDFNFRLGFLEETSVNRQVLFTRIDNWKNVLLRYCGVTPGQSLMIHMNQNSLDVFAIYFAAIESDINLVDCNPDIIIHNLADTELETLQFNKTKNYNYFDLADIKFTGNTDYKQQGTSTVYSSIQDELPKKVNVHGNVLHTKYKNSMLFKNFFLPSMSQKVEAHFALGYNDLNLGLDKIAHIVQKCAIDCIVLPHKQAGQILQDCCFKRKIDTSNLKIFYAQNDYLVQNNNFDYIDQYNDISEMFHINGKILQDNEKLYFQFFSKTDPAVAQVKINTINSYLKKKYNKTISKWDVIDAMLDLEDTLVKFRNL